MFIASRYFATVRRATGTPEAFSVSASLASDSGLRGFSASIKRLLIDWIAVLDRLLAGDRLAFAKINRLVSGFLVQLRAYDFRDEWDDLRQEVVLSLVANARAGRLRDPEAFLGRAGAWRVRTASDSWGTFSNSKVTTSTARANRRRAARSS